MKLTINKLVKKQYTSKAGKPYTKLWLECDDGKWYGAFMNKVTEKWAEGEQIEFPETAVEESKGADGRIFRNIKINAPRSGGMDTETINKRLDNIEAMLVRLLELNQSGPM